VEIKFISATIILHKEWNIFHDPKNAALVITEKTKKYTQEYGEIFYDIVVLEGEAEFLIHAKEPFTKEEAIDWIKSLDYYKENYSEPILNKSDEDFPVLISIPDSIYKHELLESFISIGCKPIVINSCFDIYTEYERLLREGITPKAVILSEQMGVLEVVKNHTKSYPNSTVIGLTGNIDDTKIVVGFIKSGAKHVIKKDSLNKDYIYTVLSSLFPDIFLEEDDEFEYE
jgi:hypothetical protein